MCDTQQRDVNDFTIYSMPDSSMGTLRRKILESARRGADDAMSLEFTSNGSIYLSSESKVLAAADGTVSADGISLLGVSPADGALTGILVENVSVSHIANTAAAEHQVSMNLNMVAPLDVPPVTFDFTVNNNSAVLNEVGYPSIESGLPLAKIFCVGKNGGSAILSVLVACLPSLVTGGPPAFLKAVLAKLPEAAIDTAQKVIKDCFS